MLMRTKGGLRDSLGESDMTRSGCVQDPSSVDLRSGVWTAVASQQATQPSTPITSTAPQSRCSHSQPEKTTTESMIKPGRDDQCPDRPDRPAQEYHRLIMMNTQLHIETTIMMFHLDPIGRVEFQDCEYVMRVSREGPCGVRGPVVALGEAMRTRAVQTDVAREANPVSDGVAILVA
ncbi:hypothetical protein K439DRAFT_1624694 [Ramaria rubella]|nr:hypothetical protein K439DRAFT_1624694 [Ramaria rubella]